MKSLKKLLSLALVVLIIITALPSVFVTAVEFDTDSDGYYLIETPAQLKSLMDNTGKITGKYRLANDIDMTGVAGQSPIGDTTTNQCWFEGTFDGNGYAIKGLDITADLRVGLFGYAQLSTFKNLTVYGTITNTKTGTNAHNCYTAGIVAGGNALTIENCVNYCTIVGNGYCAGIAGLIHTTAGSVTVKDCVNYGTISSRRLNNGGIIGGMRNADAKAGYTAEISGCINHGLIDSKSIAASNQNGHMVSGGIIGFVYCQPTTVTIKNCSNFGDVIGNVDISGTGNASSGFGGIVGRSYKKDHEEKLVIESCLNTGNVTGDMYAGGIIGFLGTGSKSTDSSIISKCVNTGDIYSLQHSGGIAGWSQSYVTTSPDTPIQFSDCFNSGKVTSSHDSAGEMHTGGIIGYCVRTNVARCVDIGVMNQPNVTTPKRSGGIIAYSYSHSGTNCYSLNPVVFAVIGNSFTADSASKTLTKTEMATQSSFNGFDFTNTWRMTDTHPIIRNVGADTLHITNSEKGRGLSLRDDGNGSFSLRKSYTVDVEVVDSETAPIVELGVLIKLASTSTALEYFKGGIYYGVEEINENAENHLNKVGKSVCYVRDKQNKDAAALKLYNYDGISSDVGYTGVLSELNTAELLCTLFTFADYRVTGINSQESSVGSELNVSAYDVARVILAGKDLSDPTSLSGDELVAYNVLSTINPYTFAPAE